MTMRSFLYLLALINAVLSTNVSTEKAPMSRYDYDYQLLSKTVSLEMTVRHLGETMATEKSTLKETKELANKMNERLAALEDVASLQGTGSTYVRWGKTVCQENGTELVYEGYVGGSDNGHKGAAVNYLCLPKDPLWGSSTSSCSSGAYIYGTEYKRVVENRADIPLVNQDAPCAVCRTKRATTLMIPGRNECYEGWTREYQGYLAAGNYNEAAASEYVCLDQIPDAVNGGGSATTDNKVFYPVEASCGSLKCPPYVNCRELTCVVCSF